MGSTTIVFILHSHTYLLHLFSDKHVSKPLTTEDSGLPDSLLQLQYLFFMYIKYFFGIIDLSLDTFRYQRIHKIYL